MTFEKLLLEGLFIIRPKIFYDERGYFFESYNEELFHKNGLPVSFAQDNQSMSKKGVLRGLHFQNPPFEQGKLVRVISGSVLDIVVDIRKGSPTFGKHFAIEIKSHDYLMFWIPPGFAHGFLSLEDNTVFSYKCTKVYNRESEDGILYNDADLKLNWNYADPVVSEKDLMLKKFKDFNSLF